MCIADVYGNIQSMQCSQTSWDPTSPPPLVLEVVGSVCLKQSSEEVCAKIVHIWDQVLNIRFRKQCIKVSLNQVLSRKRWNSDCLMSVLRILRTGSSTIVGFLALFCRCTSLSCLLSASVMFCLLFYVSDDSFVNRPSESFSSARGLTRWAPGTLGCLPKCGC